MKTNLNSSENLFNMVLTSAEQNKSISASKAEPITSLFLDASSTLLTSARIRRTSFHSSSVIVISSFESLHSSNHSKRCTDGEPGLCNCQASSAVKLNTGEIHLSKASRIKYNAVWQERLASESFLLV